MAEDGFRATPWAILKMSTRLKNLVDDGRQAAEYARNHIYYNESTVWEGDKNIPGYGERIPETGIIFREAMKALRNLHTELGFNYQYLWQAVQDSGAELKLVADYYHHTDHEIARRMDRRYREEKPR